MTQPLNRRIVTEASPILAGRAPLLIPTATKATAYTAAVSDLALMNVAGGGATLTLPAAPADKAQVGYRAIGATSAVPLVVNAGAGDTIGTAGAVTTSSTLADETTVLQYVAATRMWLGVANVRTLASLTPAALGSEPAIARTGATAGQVLALQTGGGLAFATPAAGGGGGASSLVYAANAYPARSTITALATVPVIWQGPVDPIGSGALAIDIWENTGGSV